MSRRVLLFSFLILAAAALPAHGQYPWCFDMDYFTTEVSDGMVTIHHGNAAYNCCPLRFEYSVQQNGNNVTVWEHEVVDIPCACMCCYDLPVTIGPLAPGEYWVDFIWHDEAHGEINRVLPVSIPSYGKAGGQLRDLIVVEPTDCHQEPTMDVQDGAEMPILHPGRPNPMGQSAAFDYELPAAGDVTLDIYGAGGNHVRTLAAGPAAAGPHTMTWDGKDDAGIVVSSGVYFCRLSGAEGTSLQRLIVIRDIR